jgi:hypothetical protein
MPSIKKAVSPLGNGLAGIGQFYFYTFPYAGIIQIRFRGCNLRQFLPPLKQSQYFYPDIK